MAEVRDDLLAREITRAELKELVDEYLANGGKIKQCKPADAYSFAIAPMGGAVRMSDGKIRIRKNLRSWIVKGRSKKELQDSPLKLV